VDGDGDTDVLGAAWIDNDITWWENDGFENFTEHTIGGVSGARDVYAVDLDGDRDVDVLSANHNMQANDFFKWWENDGSENFAEHTIGSGFGAKDVFATDVDGDGDLDVLGAAFSGGDIFWFENDGAGNFAKHTITGDFPAVNSIHAADLDGDGDVDILGASGTDPKYVTINAFAWWENDGAENFTEHILAENVRAVSVHAADLDGDEDLDVVGAGGGVKWWENLGAGGFFEQLVDDSLSAGFVYATDLDGDGDTDILGAGSNSVAWWKNDGTGNFTRHIRAEYFSGARSVHVADVDGDGDQDILGAAYYADKIVWWEQ
jgi:hypothetical protein